MAHVKVEAYSPLLLCLAIFIGSAIGLAEDRKDSSHLGYFYEVPEHGFKPLSSNDETKEVKEEVGREIEKELDKKVKEIESLQSHNGEYIPPRHEESERERRHGFRRKRGRHHNPVYE